MVNTIYPKELLLNKTNTTDIEPTIEILNLSISNDKISIIYDKRDDLGFDIVNFPFLECYFPRATAYGPFLN